MSSFEIRQQLWQLIKGVKNIHLSLSQYRNISSKEIVNPLHTKLNRLTPKEHLEQLIKANRLMDLDQPLLVISIRNVLSNLRCIAYLKEVNKNNPLTVNEEVLSAVRPYYCIGMKNDKLTADEIFPINFENLGYNWFFSGVPVLWEGLNEDEIFQLIVSESSDHSHVWDIPRGLHPKAKEVTRTYWRELHQIFITSLAMPSKIASEKLCAYARKHQLRREENYLHNVLGIDDRGNLVQYIGHGKMEALGNELSKKGVKKGIVVDNSGSTSVLFFPEGYHTKEPIQLFAAPNHRPAGTAYLVIELANGSFETLK